MSDEPTAPDSQDAEGLKDVFSAQASGAQESVGDRSDQDWMDVAQQVYGKEFASAPNLSGEFNDQAGGESSQSQWGESSDHDTDHVRLRNRYRAIIKGLWRDIDVARPYHGSVFDAGEHEQGERFDSHERLAVEIGDHIETAPFAVSELEQQLIVGLRLHRDDIEKHGRIPHYLSGSMRNSVSPAVARSQLANNSSRWISIHACTRRNCRRGGSPSLPASTRLL